MFDLMKDLDAMLYWMYKVAKEVFPTGPETLRARVKWIAEVDIGIMTHIFDTPKTQVGKTQQELQSNLEKDCAGHFAKKLIQLKEVLQLELSAVAEKELLEFLMKRDGIGPHVRRKERKRPAHGNPGVSL